MSNDSNDNNNNKIDYSKVVLERGETPENIKDKCFKLCRDYLGGVWLKRTIDEISVKRLSGGLTNQLYFCAINEDHRSSGSDEPEEVAIRLYGEKHFNNYDNDGNERLTDVIIALMVSQNSLGPKIYGLFENGQIQHYYRHKNFRSEEQKDPKLVNKVARILARIHALDVPIKRTGNWVFDMFDQMYSQAVNNFDLKTLYEENKCHTFLKYNIELELEWLKKTMLEIDSPFTFNHVDFRGSNIMITETDDIVLCDYEYSAYGYRGTDFGTIFCEWGQVWRDFNKEFEFPSDDTIWPFIESYIDESVILFGNKFIEDKRNSIEHILREVKVFSLFGIMFIILFGLRMKESIITSMPFNKKEIMEFMCEKRYKNYYKHKEQFFNENVFSTLH